MALQKLALRIVLPVMGFLQTKLLPVVSSALDWQFWVSRCAVVCGMLQRWSGSGAQVIPHLEGWCGGGSEAEGQQEESERWGLHGEFVWEGKNCGKGEWVIRMEMFE